MNLTTDDADGKIRLDQYLAAHLPELSRSRIQSLIKSGDVLVNGSPAKPKNPVSRGDSITVRIPEPEPAEAQPQDIPLDILYEDEDVVVINKESGLVVHPAPGTGRRGTELNLSAISRQRKPFQRTEYGKAPYSNPRAGPAFVSNPPSSGAPILADKDAATDPPFTFLRPLSGRSVHGHSQPGTIFFSSIKEK